jgi:group 4 capsule polysaccharide lipoprotein GfcB/YjbF
MRIFLPLIIVAGFALSACTSENPKIKDFGSVVPAAIKGVLKMKDKTPAVNPLASITRAQLKDIPGPLLFANLEEINAFASLSLIGGNNGVQTFLTADNISLSLRGGVALATRGLGGDLISADVSGTEAAIRKRGGVAYTRTMRWLDAQDRIRTSMFTCTMARAGRENIIILGTSYETTRVKESCTSGSENFENDYWLGSSRSVIWQSRQWLGRDAGYIALQVLIE